MEEQNKGVNIKVQDLWQILKGCWIVVLAVFIVLNMGSCLPRDDEECGSQDEPFEEQYTAKVTLWAIRDSANANGPSSSDVSSGASLTEDYKQLIKSDRIVNLVKEKLNLSIEPDILKQMASVTIDGSLLTLSISANTKELAIGIANEWAEIFCEEINTIINSGNSGDPIEAIKVWELAH